MPAFADTMNSDAAKPRATDRKPAGAKRRNQTFEPNHHNAIRKGARMDEQINEQFEETSTNLICPRSQTVRPRRIRRKRNPHGYVEYYAHNQQQCEEPGQHIAQAIANATGLDVKLITEQREDVDIEACNGEWDVTVRMPKTVIQYHGARQMWLEYTIASLQSNRMLSKREFRILMERN